MACSIDIFPSTNLWAIYNGQRNALVLGRMRYSNGIYIDAELETHHIVYAPQALMRHERARRNA